MALADQFFLDGDGLHLPDYPTVLREMQDAVRAIHGSDLYLEPDSMDGQLVALFSLAYYDLTQVLAAVYAQFSPLTAQGDGLSRQVKINGIRRLIPTNSQVDVLITGQAGTVINSGQVEDVSGNRWALPATVTIPVEGEITVTATAVESGAITVGADEVTRIVTPTRGWQSVTNATALAAASAGNPAESDAELRRRQTVSTMIPSLSVMEGIVGAVAALDRVTRIRGYENDTNTTDADGIPAHSIAIVAEGGDATEIATAIHGKKTAGTGTWAPDLAHAPAAYYGSSVSSLAIATGSKVFTTQAGLPWTTGMRLRASEQADPAKFMEGVVATYVGTTLTLTVDLIGGTGTEDAWDINLAFPGGTTIEVKDQFDVPTDIHFIRPTPITIKVEVGITALTGYIDDTAAAIAAAVADYINGLGIGEEVYLNRLYTPANLLSGQTFAGLVFGANTNPGLTYVIDSIEIAKDGDTPAAANLTLAFNEVAVCVAADDVTVTPA